RAASDLDIAEDFCARADHDTAADLGMTVAAFLASAAERYAVQERNIIFDHAGLADNDAIAMIHHDAIPHFVGPITSQGQTVGDMALQVKGQNSAFLLP